MMLGGGLLYRMLFSTLICTLALPTVARAAFEIVAYEVHVDDANRRTNFTLTFNQLPDLFGTNDADQPNHAFQYFYDAEPSGEEIDFAGEDVVIIRGAEIRIDGTIPIRDSLNPSGEEFPNAEGWGPTLGEVDFNLDGRTLTFTTGWDILRETDGLFGYRLFALEQAELTSEVTFIRRVLVPLPPPLLAGAALLALSRFLVKRM